MKRLFFVAVLILTSSCATTGKYEEVLNSWMNRPSYELFSTWGSPQDTFTDPSGRKIYTYIYDGGAVGNTMVNPYGYATTYVTSYSCKTVFTADQNDRLVSWAWQGNSCKAK